MSLQEIIESFRTGLMLTGLWVLAAIVAGCFGVWLYRSAQSTTALLRRLRTWIDGIVFTLLFMACVLIGGTKTNSPPVGLMVPLPPSLPQSVVQTVTDEDIARGYREVAETNCEASVYAMPEGITPSFNWHKRGTFGEWARLDLGDFAFPLGTNDGAVTSFSVFNDGRIRPTPRDAAREICAVGVPMLAMQGASRFWVGEEVTTERDPPRIRLTWENFFLNADTNAPVNAQIELVANGDFVTRSNDVERIYRRVEPFDWDGDGLENTIDPDPFVAGPDAHGTNAEWYNVVCSNVLEAVECDGSAGTPRPTLSWLDGVNTNAYYFVDVVATTGPAPIYFTGDRDSRLSNPVVVARGGETNHVPLLIGINYAVTSPVPFTVSIPDDGFATVTANGVSNYGVQWPLELTVVPDGMGYRVTAEPYDPGCVFQWDLPTRSVTCNYTTNGGWIGFSCHGDGFCECDGCSVSGVAMLEEASFDLPDVWCGCWHYDPLNPEIGLVFTNLPYVAVSFDKSVVFYEDAYTNAPNDVVAKHSTNTTLTVFAYGGDAGGMLYVSDQKIEKLVRVGGKAISFPYTAFVPPQSGVSFSIEYEAETHSDSERDITVTASLMPGNGGETLSVSASTTAVKLEFTPDYLIDNYPHRHRVGVRETAKCSWMPTDVAVTCEAGTGGSTDLRNGIWYYVAPLTAGASPYLTAVCQATRYPLALDVVEPQSVVAKSACAFDYEVPTNVAGGAGMELELVIIPTNVSFMGIAVQEVPSDYKDPQGYFANSYFDVVWSHTTNRGAGVWHNIQANNIFMYDYAEMGDSLPRMTPTGEITDNETYGWITGAMNWMIPVGWNSPSSTATDLPVKQICVYWQRFRMASDGTLEVEKLDNVVQRKTNTVVRLNGKIVPLRPR